jgi:hypothetical protein
MINKPDTFFDNQIIDKKPFIGIDEMMELTFLARQTIYNKCSKDEIPHIKKFGKLYFEKDKVINLILEGD